MKRETDILSSSFSYNMVRLVRLIEQEQGRADLDVGPK